MVKAYTREGIAEGVYAPLKENLAGGFDQPIRPLPDSGIIVDPMCGSGADRSGCYAAWFKCPN